MKKYLPQLPFYLLIAFVCMGIFTYVTQPDMVIQAYIDLGFPVWIYYFNLTAKILGVIALLVPQVPQKIKDFARAGFLYIFLMALIAHVMVDDGEFIASGVALLLWFVVTGISWKKS